MRRAGTSDTVVPLRNSLARGNTEEQAPNRVDIVILEIDALQPGIVPVQFFRVHKSVEQPFFRNPIDSADERFWILFQRFEDKTPVFEQPVCFRAAITETFLCQLVELPLNIERAHGFAILKLDNPFLAGIA